MSSTPIITSLTPTPSGPYAPGQGVLVVPAVSDADQRTEVEHTTGSPDGLLLEQDEQRVYTERFSYWWTVNGVDEGFTSADGEFTVFMPPQYSAAGVTVQCVVQDGQGNRSDPMSIVLAMQVPAPVKTPAGWAINVLSTLAGVQHLSRQATDDRRVTMLGPGAFRRIFLDDGDSTAAMKTTWPCTNELPGYLTRGTILSGKWDRPKLLAGVFDNQIIDLIDNYDGHHLRICAWHEPKAKGIGGPEHIDISLHMQSLVVRSGNPRVKAIVIHTADTARDGGAEPYFDPAMAGMPHWWDMYCFASMRHDQAHDVWGSPESIVGPAMDFCNAHQLRRGIAELGCAPHFIPGHTDPMRQGKWLQAAYDYLTVQGCEGISLFPGELCTDLDVMTFPSYYPNAQTKTALTVGPNPETTAVVASWLTP